MGESAFLSFLTFPLKTRGKVWGRWGRWGRCKEKTNVYRLTHGTQTRIERGNSQGPLSSRLPDDMHILGICSKSMGVSGDFFDRVLVKRVDASGTPLGKLVTSLK